MQPVNNTFETRAARLGHDITALKAGQTVTTEVTITDIDHLKTLLDDGRPDTEKLERATNLFGAMAKTVGNTETDLQQRANYYIYGGTELSQDDREALARNYPLQAIVTSAENVVYNTPTTLGISQPPMIFNYATVTINDGACISINNTELTYSADTIVRNGKPPAGLYDINILGLKGNDGRAGSWGTNGLDGALGRPGANGSNAGYATSATDGLPSLPAVINIMGQIQCNSGGTLTVYTASGAGANGGDGGKGGDGGNGNNAAGGTGGAGSNGGNAGNGTDAQGNVMVYVNNDYVDKVTAVYGDALFGQFGKKGAGGQGGNGIPQRAPNGTNGTDGAAGTRNGSHANIIIRPY